LEEWLASIEHLFLREEISRLGLSPLIFLDHYSLMVVPFSPLASSALGLGSFNLTWKCAFSSWHMNTGSEGFGCTEIVCSCCTDEHIGVCY
jgi:hypothetical protein